MEKLKNEKKNFVVELFRPAWDAHLWVEKKLKIYGAYTLLAIPFLVFVFVAQFDYVNNRNKKDFSALSPEKIKMCHFLMEREIELNFNSLSAYNKRDFVSYAEFEKERDENKKQLSLILSEAPSKGWAYNLYLKLGLIKG